MDLPKFGKYVGRPFRAFRTPDGGVRIEEFKRKTGKWELNSGLLTAVLDYGGDTDFMSEAELYEYVEKLKRKK
jgi:hypothetical protein